MPGWRPIRFHNKSPRFRQIENHIVGLIRAGELAPGEPLPSQEAMAAGYRCARETVRAALKELENVWIIMKPGVGTFVVEHPPIFPADEE